MDLFWMVFNPQAGAPVYRHPTEKAARTEAERLARINPGQTFYVLQTVGKARKTDVEYTLIQDIPF